MGEGHGRQAGRGWRTGGGERAHTCAAAAAARKVQCACTDTDQVTWTQALFGKDVLSRMTEGFLRATHTLRSTFGSPSTRATVTDEETRSDEEWEKGELEEASGDGDGALR